LTLQWWHRSKPVVVEIERIHVVVRLCEDTTTATNPDATAR